MRRPHPTSSAVPFLLVVAALSACGNADDAGESPRGASGVEATGFQSADHAGRAGGARDGRASGARTAPGDTVAGTSPDAVTGSTGAQGTEQAAEVIRSYYAAIAAGEYARAHRLWSSNGAASGQSLEEFARGYATTSSVQADVGPPGQPEGAAGSVYVKVPVVVRAVTRDGERQHFEGTYTLRRSNVDGATGEQRAWRIYDAAISAASRTPEP